MNSELFSPDLKHILSLFPYIRKYEDWVLMSRDQELSQDIVSGHFLGRPIRLEGIYICISILTEPAYVIINGKTHHTDVGTYLFILRPGDVIYSDQNPSEGLALYLLHTAHVHLQIDAQQALPIFLRMQDKHSFPISKVEFDDFCRTYEDTYRYIERTDEWGKQLFLRTLGVFTLKVADFLYHTLPEDETLLNERSRQEAWLFSQFMTVLGERCSRQLTVAYYAERLHTSYKHFSSIIKRVSGRGASEWIDFYLLNEAKSLISHSGLTLQEIAYRLDFSSPSHFSKFFRQHTGQTPSEYQITSRAITP